MNPTSTTRCSAFVGTRCIATGDLRDVARAVREALDEDGSAQVLVFDDTTGEQIEIDTRGSVADVLGRLPTASEASGAETPAAPRGPGRPKLGVVSREVTLLPRHWEWLGSQPGGASVALRKLVEEARRVNAGADRVRAAQEATYRFMTTIAGDLPGYEEATRALYAGDAARFGEIVAAWPADVSAHTGRLAKGAF